MALALRRWQWGVAGLALAGSGLLLTLFGLERNVFPARASVPEVSPPALAVAVIDDGPSAPTVEPPPREALDLARSRARLPSGTTGIEVLVRRAGEHRGAVGVPVYFLDSSMLDEDRTDLDGQALRRGLCFTSGADGMAIVPEPVGDFRVLAMDDGWFGRTTEIGPGRRLEIVLGRDELVRVRVVDEQKQPIAGVPVRLFTRSESGKSGWVHEVVESAENGIATLHPRRAEGRGDWFVSLAIEDPDAVELAVDPHTLPREPLSLVLPDHGAVDVLVTDRDGQPDRRVETVWLEFENEAKSAARRLEPRALLQRPLHEGRATFPFVRADTLFAVKGPGVESPLVHLRPDERRTVAVVDSQAGPSVVTRVLEAPGVPYVDGLVRIREAADPLAWNSGLIRRTDGDGRVCWSYTDQGVGRSFRMEVACADRFRAPLSARFEIAPHAGVNELGDLLLLPTPVLVSGVVVDENGAPIAGADVLCGVPRADLGGEPEWREDLGTVSGPDGTFVLHAETGNAPLLLAVTRNGYAPRRDVSLSPGASAVRVELAKHARIVGKVLVNASSDRMALDVAACSERDGRVYRGTLVSGEAGFEIPALPAGDYMVWVRWRPGAENLTLRRVPVSVAAGATASDPALDPVDLREELHDIELQLVVPQGSKLTEVQLTLRDASLGERGPSISTRVYGPATVHELRVPWASTDVEVRAPGLRLATVRGVREKERIVLEPGIPVLLRMKDEDARALDGTGASFEIALQTPEEAESTITRRYVPWDPLAGTELAMPEARTYRAVVRLSLRRQDFLPITETFLLDAVDVDESRVDTPVELALPPAARRFLAR